jgi:hypothetical protein
MLQPAPPVLKHQSVLQVLLGHAYEADRHARDSVASVEMHCVLREAIVSNTVGIDPDLLARAFDMVTERSGAGAVHSVVEDAAAHVTAAVGPLNLRVWPTPSGAGHRPATPTQIAAPRSAATIKGQPACSLSANCSGAKMVGRRHGGAGENSQIESIDERRLLWARL